MNLKGHWRPFLCSVMFILCVSEDIRVIIVIAVLVLHFISSFFIFLSFSGATSVHSGSYHCVCL